MATHAPMLERAYLRPGGPALVRWKSQTENAAVAWTGRGRQPSWAVAQGARILPAPSRPHLVHQCAGRRGSTDRPRSRLTQSSLLATHKSGKLDPGNWSKRMAAASAGGSTGTVPRALMSNSIDKRRKPDGIAIQSVEPANKVARAVPAIRTVRKQTAKRQVKPACSSAEVE